VPLTLRVIDDIEHGRANPVPQDASQATLAPRIPKEAGAIDWSRSPEEIGWHVRAMQPWPMPFTFLHRTGSPPLRVLIPTVATPEPQAETRASPGTAIASPPGRLFVATGSSFVEILRIQLSGKRVMETAEFLRGHPLGSEARFGPD
jgi:methionyl-tRNA formyltransferase